MNRSCLWALIALLASITLPIGGCGDSSEPLVPGTLQVMAGDGQSALAGSQVAIPPSVKVLSTRGKAMGGVVVTFSSSGDGQVAPPQQTTNAQGVAALTSWTLPRQVGSHQLTVSSAGVTPVVITATATVGAPARLSRASPDVQNGAVGTAIGAPPIVRVTDQHDNPVSGATVNFVASHEGVVTSRSAVSDANGLARSDGWTLGVTAGPQTLLATLAAVPTLPGIEFVAVAAAAAPSSLTVVTQPSTTNATGERLSIQPVIEIRDHYNNRVLNAANPVTVSVAAGSTQTLSGTLTVAPATGRATFTDLVITGTGTAQLHFAAGGLSGATSAEFNVPATTQCSGTPALLNFAPGESQRWLTSSPGAPACLDFTQAASAGHEYLVQIENVALSGNSDTGLFPGPTVTQNSFVVAVTTGTLADVNTVTSRASTGPAGAVHSWDFGGGPIYEIEPREPVGGVRPAIFLRGDLRLDANAVTSAAAVGDTLAVFMAGIPRLGIADGEQRAVVRYVGPDLIIAEDVRLPTLTRQGGGTNTPLTMADMEGIAADYAQYAKVQADRFFQNRYNTSIEQSGGPPIAIHSLMYADNIWGYTYPNGNYFVWDFWAGTDGSTRGVNQQIERNANNLFMHEIAHMRHWGMVERAGRTTQRGNRWLVEGFARASERWPIAMRLTGITEFSRTGNIILPTYSTSTLNSLEDVPVYTASSISLYGGYAASSYVFDYFADQVALTAGTDWRSALGEFLVNAGVENDLNTVITRYLPGVDVGTLFTRARLALFLDDYTSGLPGWTQFHQFQLRASRQTQNPQLDPRNLWPRILPGTSFEHSREILPGAAFAYVIDGGAATANARIVLQYPRVSYGIMSVTRVR